MILLWGLPSEGPLAAVREELARLGVPALLLDQRRVLDTEIELAVDAEVAGAVRTVDWAVDLRAVSAFYARPYDTEWLAAIAAAGPASAAWRHAALVEDAMWAWAELTPAFVVSRPAAIAVNGSKPYQLEWIRRLGFAVPDTLITTDPRAARAFWERHGVVIYKSVSAVRSRVARLGPEHAGRLADVASCPTQFQEYIAGRDHRVHVVGDELFACEVLCDADDYRYHPAAIRACGLPAEIAERCLALAAAMGLPVAGIDLRRSPDGEWHCFEVNPTPAFTYYERVTRQPIGRAIARLLAAAS